MSFPFSLRLMCVVLASFSLVFGLTSLLVNLVAPLFLRMLERLAPKTASRCALTLRLLPAQAASLAALVLAAPSYWRYEQRQQTEEVGWLCEILALIAVALLTRSLIRTMRALYQTRQASPSLALTGIWRPKVCVPKDAIGVLSQREMDLVLRHEFAHAASRDNLKRLLMLVAPAFPGSAVLESAWRRFAEWTADDQAAEGGPASRLALASALVNVARLGISPENAPLSIAFAARPNELEQRIDRLLSPTVTVTTRWALLPECMAALSIAAAVCASLNQARVHGVLERLIH